MSAEIMDAVVAEILDHDDLVNDPEWETFALAAEMIDGAEIMAAFRYTEDGPPVPSQTLVDSRLLQQLREAMSVAHRPWRVCILKIRRDGPVAWEFLAGDDATPWVVTTGNYQKLAHGLRPRAEDFRPA